MLRKPVDMKMYDLPTMPCILPIESLYPPISIIPRKGHLQPTIYPSYIPL